MGSAVGDWYLAPMAVYLLRGLGLMEVFDGPDHGMAVAAAAAAVAVAAVAVVRADG